MQLLILEQYFFFIQNEIKNYSFTSFSKYSEAQMVKKFRKNNLKRNLMTFH